jgi:hypothetical protein
MSASAPMGRCELSDRETRYRQPWPGSCGWGRTLRPSTIPPRPVGPWCANAIYLREEDFEAKGITLEYRLHTYPAYSQI